MDVFQTMMTVLIVATGVWAYMKLKQRIEFLEHEVRWLRNELEGLKPTEIKSAYGYNQAIARFCSPIATLRMIVQRETVRPN